jgi:hypothetical protein
MKLKNFILQELLHEKEDVFVPRVSPEERKKRRAIEVQKKIQEYIKDGSSGDLDLTKEPISELPDNLTKVGGNLDLENTPITSLPNNLKVGGSLYLRNTNIKSIPKNLKVDRALFLSF